MADFDHFREHSKTLCPGARSWAELGKKLKSCATCSDICDLVDRRLRARFVKKLWKSRDSEILDALGSASSARFVSGDGMACSFHTARHPNSDYHSQVLVECEERCAAHEDVAGSFEDCGCSLRRFHVCLALQQRLQEYRRVMCPRQLFALDYREYKALSLALAGGEGND